MAQLRVTDYFPQSKSGGPGPKHRKLQPELSLPCTPPRTAAPLPGPSGSRKRARPAGEPEPRPGEPKRSARKRLLLPGDEELASSSTVLQPSTPPSLDKKAKNQVNVILSPGPSQNGWQEDLNFLDVKAEPTGNLLESRLQRIQQLTQKVCPQAPTVTNTSDLKSRLKRVQELRLKIQERQARQEKEKSDLVVAKEKASTEESPAAEKVPAYQRFHVLAQAAPPGLSLPYKYKLLAEMFRSMDTIVGMLFNRSETVTFGRVKQGVQDMTRRQFEETHVGQIKAVYPAAYSFRQETNVPTYKNDVKKSDHQLTIEPLISEEDKVDGRPQLSASRMLERRRLFSSNLVTIVKRHHRVFLESLDPPVLIPEDRLTRWHPRFNVDGVPEIPPAELPQPPCVDKLTTAQDVLNRARGMITPKMEKALANLTLRTVENCSAEKKEAVVDPPKSGPLAGVSAALKGVSQSLLERIRAKEAQKIQALMTRNPQQEERLGMISRLPEMARILRNVFVSEKKPALTMEVACTRVIGSYRSSMTPREMEKHLRLLSELVPKWLGIHLVRKETYLKLDKAVDLSIVVEALDKRMKEEEGS